MRTSGGMRGKKNVTEKGRTGGKDTYKQTDTNPANKRLISRPPKEINH